MPPIIAGILSSGTEILQGLYADTNARWLNEQLSLSGITVGWQMAAPDDEESLVEALEFLADRCRIIIMTGGLGPTEDDLTRQAVCRVFETDLVADKKAWGMIEKRFALRGTTPPASNRIQTMIPRIAETLYNEWGTAPGFCIDKKGVFLAALPGPPREMSPMFLKYLAGPIAEEFAGGHSARIRTLHTFGYAESFLNDRLRPVFQELRGDPQRLLGFQVGDAKVDIRMRVEAHNPPMADQVLKELEDRVISLLPAGCIYGVDSDTLEEVVSRLISERGLKIAIAESCTGGLVAKRITDLPGASDVLLEGWVTYTNEAKRAELGVRRDTLERYGAVSSQVARQMALGALRRSGADVAVSITGIAGPGGGSETKPVGTVWYGLAWRTGKTSEPGDPQAGKSPNAGAMTVQSIFPSSREMVRAYASHRALDLVRRHLLSLPSDYRA